MTLALLVYLAGVLSKLEGSLIIAILAGIICMIAGFICMIDKRDTAFQWKMVKRGVLCAVISMVTFTLTPTEKTMYVMAGAYAAQSIAENPNVQRISGKVITIIDQKLDTFIEEGIEEAKKAAKKTVEEKTK